METLTGQCLEWKRKFHASELANRALRKDRALLTGALLVYMAYHPAGTPFFAGVLVLGMVHRNTLVNLAAVLGSQLLPMTSSLKNYVSQVLRRGTRLWQSTSRQIRSALGHLVQFVERIHRRIHEWKSVSVSKGFNTAS